ncbi:amidase signature domain-containing protein [Ilyonectria destructans]|nr:amidase signature domain-containing protein [Ilyonectria destructans]
MSWRTIAKEARTQVLDSIPSRWHLDPEKYKSLKDVTSIPETCGILTDRQLEITGSTVVDIVKRLESREWKAVQVLESFAARAAIAHQLVNCLTDWFYEDGIAQAKALDEMLDNGGQLKGPLHGVPIALKDSHEVKGHSVTMGYVSRRNNVAKQDSALVGTLRAAGAVFFCKTTMPQSGMALETVSNIWGRTVNPFNRDLSAGGSSGGDAVLVALRGSPVTPSTDMGGSIRVPAAFNGLYGIRPTSDRIPKGGMVNTNTGNVTIKLSCGPVCRSLDDLELFTSIINAYPRNKHDPTSVPVPWRQLSRDVVDGKLTIGIMKWDRVVMPHPPVLRALEHTRKVLEKAGHEVVDFSPPFDCWNAKQTTFDIYYQSGCGGTMSTLAAAGEPTIPAFADLLKVFNVREQSAAEALKLNLKTRALKEQFLEAWNDTAHQATSGRCIDALITPPAPAVGYPHDFNVYWGYTSLFNLIDYPSIILPIPNFKVDAQLDPTDTRYRPLETNPYDKPNHDLYDPKLFANQPSTIQIVGRPFEDEEAIQVASVLDNLFETTT